MFGKNMKSYFALFLLFPLFALVAYAEPIRDAGLSLHMLPDRVAKLSNERGGFTITGPVIKRRGKAISDVKTMMKYIESIPESSRANGVWIVYTHPSSYTESEKKKITELITACAAKKIRVFTCRASDLPEAKWKEGKGIEE